MTDERTNSNDTAENGGKENGVQNRAFETARHADASAESGPGGYGERGGSVSDNEQAAADGCGGRAFEREQGVCPDCAVLNTCAAVIAGEWMRINAGMSPRKAASTAYRRLSSNTTDPCKFFIPRAQ